jgi:hypothetical protein
VCHGGKLGPRIGTHPLSGRVECGKTRKRLFEGQKASKKGVIVTIRNLRAGLHIVEVVVPSNGPAEILGKGLRLGPGQGMDWCIEVQFFLRQRGLLGAS